MDDEGTEHLGTDEAAMDGAERGPSAAPTNAAGDEAPAAARKPRRRRQAVDAPDGPADGTITRLDDARPAPDTGGVVLDGDSSNGSAGPLELRRRAASRISAGEITVEQGAIGAARADRLALDRGAVGAAMAGEVEISRSYARSIVARQVQLDQAAARVVIAADVKANQSAAMILIARKVDGNMKVLLDWRGALAFGAVTGLILALITRGRRRGGRDEAPTEGDGA